MRGLLKVFVDTTRTEIMFVLLTLHRMFQHTKTDRAGKAFVNSRMKPICVKTFSHRHSKATSWTNKENTVVSMDKYIYFEEKFEEEFRSTNLQSHILTHAWFLVTSYRELIFAEVQRDRSFENSHVTKGHNPWKYIYMTARTNARKMLKSFTIVSNIIRDAGATPQFRHRSRPVYVCKFCCDMYKTVHLRKFIIRSGHMHLKLTCY